VLALVMYLVARRDLYRPWIGAVSSAIDVSLVSGTLLLYLELGSPWRALNSRVVFDAYFLAIIASCLRYDLRISIGAGSLAVLQYAGILFAAPPGSFDWPAQAARLLLLAGATVLGAAVVLRTQALRQLSRSDRLTGLPNRSYFDERSQAELSRARRHGHAISLAMIDIDHFKRFNDTMGHAAGDIALKAVGATIQRQVRASDLVVRYGGEEFVAVFPGMNAHAAMERMELVRKEVAALALEIPRHNGPCGVTISAGIAGYGVDGVEVEDLLDCADGRLYQAKEAGRNRLVGPPTELLDAPPTWRTSGTMPGVAK
jgi:diguanylate cyclase (GGDEF)-like protein